MFKAMHKTTEIGSIMLEKKSGGKSGDFIRPEKEQEKIKTRPGTKTEPEKDE